MQRKCFCGSTDFVLIKIIKPDTIGNGQRAVIMQCLECRRRVKFNKWGQKTIGGNYAQGLHSITGKTSVSN